MAELKITLVRSLNGSKKDQIATAHSIKLKKIGDTVVQPDNPATRGKIFKLKHLLKAEEVK